MWERPDNATLGLVGDFQAPAMLQLLEEGLGQWQVSRGGLGCRRLEAHLVCSPLLRTLKGTRGAGSTPFCFGERCFLG